MKKEEKIICNEIIDLLRNKSTSFSDESLKWLLQQPIILTALSLLILHLQKKEVYGNSWEKRGDIGILLTIARKWDRLENYLLNNTKLVNGNVVESNISDESFGETIRDLTTYLLMWCNRVRDTFTDDWDWFLTTKLKKWEDIDEKNQTSM